MPIIETTGRELVRPLLEPNARELAPEAARTASSALQIDFHPIQPHSEARLPLGSSDYNGVSRSVRDLGNENLAVMLGYLESHEIDSIARLIAFSSVTPIARMMQSENEMTQASREHQLSLEELASAMAATADVAPKSITDLLRLLRRPTFFAGLVSAAIADGAVLMGGADVTEAVAVAASVTALPAVATGFHAAYKAIIRRCADRRLTRAMQAEADANARLESARQTYAPQPQALRNWGRENASVELVVHTADSPPD